MIFELGDSYLRVQPEADETVEAVAQAIFDLGLKDEAGAARRIYIKPDKEYAFTTVPSYEPLERALIALHMAELGWHAGSVRRINTNKGFNSTEYICEIKKEDHGVRI